MSRHAVTVTTRVSAPGRVSLRFPAARDKNRAMNRKLNLRPPPRDAVRATGGELVLLPVRVADTHDVFPQGATDLHAYLLDHAPPDHPVRVATTGDRFTELAQHNILCQLGEWAVQWVGLPTLTGLLANYIYDRYRNPAKVDARVTIHTERCAITFEGSGAQLATTLEAARKLVESGHAIGPEPVNDVTHLLEDDAGAGP